MNLIASMFSDAFGRNANAPGGTSANPSAPSSNDPPRRPKRPPFGRSHNVDPDQLLADPANVEYDPADHPDDIREIVAAFYVSDTLDGYYSSREHYLTCLMEDNPDVSEGDLVKRVKQEEKDGIFKKIPVLCDFYAGRLYPYRDVPEGKVKDGWNELMELQKKEIADRKAKEKKDKADQAPDLSGFAPEIQTFRQQWQNNFTDEQKKVILGSGTLSWLHIVAIFDLLSEEEQRRLQNIPAPPTGGSPQATPPAGSNNGQPPASTGSGGPVADEQQPPDGQPPVTPPAGSNNGTNANNNGANGAGSTGTGAPVPPPTSQPVPPVPPVPPAGTGS